MTVTRARIRFLAVAFGTALVGVAGYLGFVTIVASDRGATAGLLVLGAATGFAAFFSPCSFPLLLTFLARRAEDSPATATASALRVGGGVAGLLAVIGLVVVAGGSAIGGVVSFDSVPGRVFRGVVGTGLIVLGLRQSGIVALRMKWLDRVAGASARHLDAARGSGRRDVLYGFGYLLAGFG